MPFAKKDAQFAACILGLVRVIVKLVFEAMHCNEQDPQKIALCQFVIISNHHIGHFQIKVKFVFRPKRMDYHFKIYNNVSTLEKAVP